MKYPGLILSTCIIVIFLYLAERLNHEFMPYVLAVEFTLACSLGIVVIYSDKNETIIRCALIGSMIAVIKLILILPSKLWNISEWQSDFILEVTGLLLAIFIQASIFAFLGAIGGLLSKVYFRKRQ